MSGPSITAAVITLNEAANLPGWLAAHAWADERLVVDGGSGDGTADVARAAGARVLVGSFEHFAQQRNVALAAARGDWVFFVDADERPNAALVSDLRGRLAHCRQNAFRAPIRSSILGRRFRFSGTQDDRPLRLVRRGCGRWAGQVHEVLQVAGTRGELAGWLDHVTLPDVPALLKKINRYTTLAASARLAAGATPARSAAWLAPAREVFRRLCWKQGWLDGPEGWVFCLLSGLSEWVLEHKHRELLRSAARAVAAHAVPAASLRGARGVPLRLCAGSR
jgi:glycosyltransferase involved in cell wall biosynthesis